MALIRIRPSETTDPLVSGMDADPDGDGQMNLLEYGFWTNPKIPSAASLPTVETFGDNLVLSFPRVKGVADLNYAVEVSQDLTSWYSGSAYTEEILTIDRGETEIVKVQDRTPMSALERRFMRLRVSSQSIDTGLRLWLDAGQQITKDGSGAVSEWGDASGSSNDASQTTSANQPTWIDDSINGRPIIRFDGQDDKLAAAFSPGTDSFTIFAVAKAAATHENDPESITGTAGTSGQKYLLGAKASGSNAGAGLSLGTNGMAAYEHGDSFMPAVAAFSGTVGNGVLAELQYQSKQPTLFLNGQLVRVGLQSGRLQVFAPSEVGAGEYGAFAGDIAEIMIYNRALSAAERATVESYLSHKYELHIIPEVTISDPQNGSSFDTERINVSGQVVHASALASLVANGTHAFVTGNSFEARNVPLQPGHNTITAVATDIFGHTGSASVSVAQGPAPVDPVTLQVNSTSGFGPLSVTFQTTATVPGDLLEVRYDFNGDGVIDQVAYTLDDLTHLYDQAGDFLPVVTVVTTVGSFSSVGGWFGNLADGIAIHIQAPPEPGNLTSFADPVDLKSTKDGSLYILSKSAAKVTQFDPDGTPVRTIAGIGLNPSGLDVDITGNVFIALTGNHQVVKLKPAGMTFVVDADFHTTGKIGRTDGTAGGATGEFNEPYDVALSPDGQALYVTDRLNHRIQKFSAAGEFLTAIGQSGAETGQLSFPKGISQGSDGSIYVVDSGNHRISRLDADALTATFGAQGDGPLEFQNPTNVSADGSSIYVADTGNNRIVAINRPTREVPRYTSRWVSTGAIILSAPASVAAADTPIEDRVCIADTGNNQIQKFLLPKPSPAPIWIEAKTHLSAGNIETGLERL